MQTIPFNNKLTQKYISQFLKNWKHPIPILPDNHIKVILYLFSSEHPPDNIELTRKLITQWTNTLHKTAPENAELIRQRYFMGKSIQMLSNQFNYSTHQINRRIKQAQEELHNIADRQIHQKYSSWYTKQSIKIPFSETNELVGISDHITHLEKILSPTSPQNIVTITGIGGIGKSSLTSLLARRLLSKTIFQHFLWINAEKLGNAQSTLKNKYDHITTLLANEFFSNQQSSTISELEVLEFMASHSCLIVIDGIGEQEAYQTLLNKLSHYPPTTKIIITSRRRPNSTTPTFLFTLNELNYTNTEKLIIKHSQSIGLDNQTAKLIGDLENIYQLVGGNPLAIKLVIGLLHTYPLSVILKDLKKVNINNIEMMYRSIYWQAWKSLKPQDQKLLAAMPLFSQDGANINMLLSITELSPTEIFTATQTLLTRSLIEYRSMNNEEQRYGIHHLTRSFLHSEIIKWPKSP